MTPVNPDRFGGEVTVPSVWRLHDDAIRIRIVGEYLPMEGGWLYEYVEIEGKEIKPGGKKKRMTDDVLRDYYQPVRGAK